MQSKEQGNKVKKQLITEMEKGGNKKKYYAVKRQLNGLIDEF